MGIGNWELRGWEVWEGIYENYLPPPPCFPTPYTLHPTPYTLAFSSELQR
ncbi:MAG: hypothetical protein F6J93_39510 [Oscillatoria sp. SIO1A7]|nr:hypothetical protein [Oscillatoria sp. SIO1A7]